MRVTSYKQGASLVLAIPSEYNLKENQDFEVKKLSDGSLLFSPIDNSLYPPIWEDNPKDIYLFNKEISSYDDGKNYGRENISY